MTRPADKLTALAGEHGWAASVVEADGAAVLHLRRGRQVLLGLWEAQRWRCGVAMWRGDAGLLQARQFGAVVAAPDVDQALDEIGEQARRKRAALRERKGRG